MKRKQQTISRPVSCTGIGLHTGVECTITFKPAPENYGIRFIRTDIKNSPEIKADIDHVVDISRGTTIEEKKARIHTVEHALAAVSGLRIDNVLIELTSKEPPVMDGSAKDFVEVLLASGIVGQENERNVLEIRRAVNYTDPYRDIDIHVIPSDRFRVTFMVEYPLPSLGTQYEAIYNMAEDFAVEVAPARTFCFLSEVEMLKENGLIKGGVKIAMSALDNGRFTVASGSVGVIQACLNESVKYANTRKTFGKKIGEHQLVQSMIAKMSSSADIGRLLYYKAGWMKNQGMRNTRETALAKWINTEAAWRSADDAVQIHGAYGYSNEFPLERYLRNSRGSVIYEGSKEIQQIIQAEYALGYRKDKDLRCTLPKWPFEDD